MVLVDYDDLKNQAQITASSDSFLIGRFCVVKHRNWSRT